MKGWVKFHRRLLSSDLWLAEKFTKGQAWVDLFSLANHKDKSIWIRGVEVKIKRGQLAWSELSLSERWSWSRNKVRRFLKWLKTEHQIEQQKTNVTSLILIVNYDRYQVCDTPSDTPNDTPERHQKDTKRYTNKNEENEKKNIYTSNFLSFWKSYPRKIGKGKAFQNYKNIKDPKPSLQIVLDAIEIQNKSEQWQDKQFIPHPATWLSQRRWEDEIEPDPINGSKLSTKETLEKHGL